MTDELIALWQQGIAAHPDPREVARLAARASMTRFDVAIARRNWGEYAGCAALLAAGIVVMWAGRMVTFGLLMIVPALFVAAFLWWHHRHLVPLDPAADAAAYRTALLARIDKQIRLLRSVWFWYLMPLSVPSIAAAVNVWPRSPRFAMGLLAGAAVLFAAVGWWNQHAGVRVLERQREEIEKLSQAA